MLPALLIAGCAPTAEDASFDWTGLPQATPHYAAWRDAVDAAERCEQVDEAARSALERFPDHWQPHWAMGECRRRLRDDAAAREHLRRGLESARRADVPYGIARCAIRLTQASADLPPERREETAREALRAARRQAADAEIATAANLLAGAVNRLGRYAEAREFYEESEAALLRLGLVKQAVAPAHNAATVVYALGNTADARELAERTHARALRVGNGYVAASAAMTLGRIELQAGRLDEAEAWFDRVVSERAGLLVRLAANRAQLALRRGELARAGEILAEIGGRQRVAEDRLQTLGLLAEAQRRAGDLSAAHETVAGLVEQSDRDDLWEARWLTRSVLGRIHRDGGRPVEARRLLGEALEVIRLGGRRNVGGGLGLLRERAEPFADLAALSLELADGAARAFELADEVHARELRRLLGEGRPPGTARPDQLQRELAPGSLLLQFILGEERGVVIGLDRGGPQAAPIAGHREIAPAVEELRRALAAPLRSAEARLDPAGAERRLRRAGRALYELALAPLTPMLARARTVWIVPDRELALVPFASLELPSGEWLGTGRAIGRLPLAGSRPPGRLRDGRVLVAGDPVAPPDGWEPLPRAGDEIERVAAIWESRASVLAREALTLDRLAAAADTGIALLHLATHARASSWDPRRAAVALSDGQRLDIDRIARLRLRDAVVVLSACRTGEGEVVPGEGVVGLSWAFLRGEADSLVVSLFDVDDAAAGETMAAFHAALRRGAPPVEALAAARRDVWSPFVLIARPGQFLP